MKAIFRCEYCQAWPDGYTCSNPKTFIKDGRGQLLGARECFYAYLNEWEDTWMAHPCPFFIGTIDVEFSENKITHLVVNEENSLPKYID